MDAEESNTAEVKTFIKEQVTAAIDKQLEDLRRPAVEQMKSYRAALELDKEYSKWNSDATSKLYYPFWILFMGGFVYSLTMATPQPDTQNFALSVHLFRIIAIVGTALNFLAQKAIIDMTQMKVDLHRELTDLENELASGHPEDAMKVIEKIDRSFFTIMPSRKRIKWYNRGLMAVGVVFLIGILIVTWNIVGIPDAASALKSIVK